MIKDLNTKEGLRVLQENYIGRLAFIAHGRPYVLPITYFYDEPNNAIISYTGEGHKLNSMRLSNSVSFQVDEIESANKWQSVLIHGMFEELSGSDARYQLHQFAAGVKDIIERKEKKDVQFIGEFSSKISTGEIPIVYRLKIIEMTGKLRRPDDNVYSV